MRGGYGVEGRETQVCPETEKPSLAMSMPLGKLFGGARERDQCNMGDGAQDVVVNRLSLSVGDISFMRLRGCRVTASVHSAQGLHQQDCCDFSCSTNQMVSLHHATPQGASHAASTSHIRGFQEVKHTIHNVDDAASETPLLYTEEENDALVSTTTGGACEGDCATSQPVISSRCTSSQQLEDTGSFGKCVTPLRRKSTVTPLVSPRTDLLSSVMNLGPGVQPVSTWRFPVLGKVESASAATARHDGHVKTDDGRPSNEVLPKEVGNINVNGGMENDVECDNNAGSSSTLETLENRRYMKRLRFVYAMYESILAADDCNGTLMQETLKNMPIHEIQRTRMRFCSLSSTSTAAAAASGYYSLGSRRSMQHPNKQILPIVSPSLDNLSNRQHDEHQRSCMTVMDPTIVSLIEQRPLLQTTMFLEFVYNRISRQLRVQQSRHLPVAEASNWKRGKRVTESAVVGVTDASSNADTTCIDRSHTDRLKRSALRRGDETEVGARGGSETVVNAPGPAKPFEEPLATMYRRVLTQVLSWRSKVHSVDGISRCVDNESDDLVVHVGMILMGWLEVVDLLGAGTFGQVFLCKDLRISNRSFLHPSEIEGEDFQYWQCSHEYIPFGDPAMMPTHPPLVAVKVVKSRALFEQQSVLEAEMLVYIGAKTASQQGRNKGQITEGFGTVFHIPEPPASDPRCSYVAKIFAHGVCYGHHCIVMERYGANLFEYVRSRGFKGLPMYQIQVIGRKILKALTLLHEECHVVHCDIKPENVLLTLDSCFSIPTVHGTGATASDGIIGGSGGSMKMALETSAVLMARSAIRSCNNSTDVSTPVPLRVHPTAPAEKFKNLAAAAAAVAAAAAAASQSRDMKKGSERGAEGAVQKVDNAMIAPLQIKLIDFSSSFYVDQCMYTYMQSRYYRAPEVILAAGCGPPIDIWSTGCLLAELLLGLPLLPGTTDYHQLYLMEEMLGPLPVTLLQKGRRAAEYYHVEEGELESRSIVSGSSMHTHSKTKHHSSFRLLSEDEYRAQHEHAPQAVWKCYFQYRTLAELVRKCMLTVEERLISMGRSPIPSSMDASDEDAAPPAASSGMEQQRPIKAILDEMMQQRFWLYDLLKKMLHGDPSQRLTAREALSHPFFGQTPQYMKPYLSVVE